MYLYLMFFSSFDMWGILPLLGSGEGGPHNYCCYLLMNILAKSLCFFVSAPCLFGATNLLINGDLEDLVIPSGTAVSYPWYGENAPPTVGGSNPIDAIPGWTRYVSTYDWEGFPTFYQMSPATVISNGYTTENAWERPVMDSPFGNQYAQSADVYQEVSHLTVGQTYRLSAWGVVFIPQNTGEIESLFAVAAYNTSEFTQFSSSDVKPAYNLMNDYSGGVVLHPDSDVTPVGFAGLSASGYHTEDGFVGVEGVNAWREISVDFVATSEEMTIYVAKYATIIGPCSWDNVSLTAVPEPSAALLAAAGVMTAFVRRRR